jgi:hypothetical protein
VGGLKGMHTRILNREWTRISPKPKILFLSAAIRVIRGKVFPSFAAFAIFV